jgi:hypothetical protein
MLVSQQDLEIQGLGGESQMFQSPTSLYYTLVRRSLNLLELSIGQVHMDTHFSIWRALLGAQSQTAMRLTQFSATSILSATQYYEFLEKHFELPPDAQTRLREQLEPLAGRPRPFFDHFLRRFLASNIRDYDESQKLLDHMITILDEGYSVSVSVFKVILETRIADPSAKC